MFVQRRLRKLFVSLTTSRRGKHSPQVFVLFCNPKSLILFTLLLLSACSHIAATIFSHLVAFITSPSTLYSRFLRTLCCTPSPSSTEHNWVWCVGLAPNMSRLSKVALCPRWAPHTYFSCRFSVYPSYRLDLIMYPHYM